MYLSVRANILKFVPSDNKLLAKSLVAWSPLQSFCLYYIGPKLECELRNHLSRVSVGARVHIDFVGSSSLLDPL